MKIIIDIPEDRYKDIQRIASVQLEKYNFQTAEQIIANGTPLPKGHGRLVDADALYDQYAYADYDFDKTLEYAPTIIEADTESEEGEE